VLRLMVLDGGGTAVGAPHAVPVSIGHRWEKLQRNLNFFPAHTTYTGDPMAHTNKLVPVFSNPYTVIRRL
jgi:hypothetical protein